MINMQQLKRTAPDVSVIVVSYSQNVTINLILRSLLNQTATCNYEVIVTDDGSKSSLFEAVRQIAQSSDISMKYVWQQDKGIRPTEARNNGIKIAKGKILLFLDGDMVPEKDLIEKHFGAHKKSSSNLIVAGNRVWRGVINKHNKKFLEKSDINTILRALASEWDTDDESVKRNKFENRKRMEWLGSKFPWKACFGCNLSVKNTKDVYFDENYYGWGNDDWELVFRLYQKGYKPVYLKRAVAYHLESEAAITNAFRTHKQTDIVMNMRNICYFYDKCPGLELEDAFFGFIRFELNKKTNKWKILPRPDSYTRDELRNKVLQVRGWLKKNGIYTAKRKI